MNRMRYHTFRRILVFAFILPVSMYLSCANLIGPNEKWEIPAEIVGQWKSGKAQIVVRTEPRWMKFKFTGDSAIVSLEVKSDKTAEGRIGSAIFVNGKVRKNKGNPEKTGVAYIIECGSIGKIFPNDPLNSKEVELWLSPVKGTMDAELRFTERGACFPMAGIRFSKIKEE